MDIPVPFPDKESEIAHKTGGMSCETPSGRFQVLSGNDKCVVVISGADLCTGFPSMLVAPTPRDGTREDNGSHCGWVSYPHFGFRRSSLRGSVV